MAENGRNGTSHPNQPTMRHHVAMNDPGPPDRELLRTLALDPHSLPQDRLKKAIRHVALFESWNRAYEEALIAPDEEGELPSPSGKERERHLQAYEEWRREHERDEEDVETLLAELAEEASSRISIP